MVDLVLLQSVSYIAGALGVCVAAIYYMMTLRVQQANMKANLETRQAQFLLQLVQALITNPDSGKKFIEIMSWKWRARADGIKYEG